MNLIACKFNLSLSLRFGAECSFQSCFVCALATDPAALLTRFKVTMQRDPLNRYPTYNRTMFNMCAGKLIYCAIVAAQFSFLNCVHCARVSVWVWPHLLGLPVQVLLLFLQDMEADKLNLFMSPASYMPRGAYICFKEIL